MTKTQPSKKELLDYIKTLEAKIESLSLDPSYGILTRQALGLRLPGVEKEIGLVCFLDVDYLHDFNSTHGHEEANARIGRALRLRSSDIVLPPVKWYSGDEIVILLKGKRKGFISRLRKSFKSEGMSITIAAVPYSGDIAKDVSQAQKIVMQSKAARGASSR